MNKLIKDLLLLAICGRLLYIEPELELTILEGIATVILFLDFSFRKYVTGYINKQLNYR